MFASKIAHSMHGLGNSILLKGGDVQLSFISTSRKYAPVALRLDGIYFNSSQKWKEMNEPIKRSYDDAEAVIVQSGFDQELVKRYFGDRDNLHVIPNGTSFQVINDIPLIDDKKLDGFSEVWSIASHWRPHKRLNENIEYFNLHAPKDACLIVMGETNGLLNKELVDDSRMFFVGEIVWTQLIGLLKRSDKFIHLSWLDHCPNVVIDARATGCQIICSSAGGTVEVAGKNAIVIKEDTWDLNPTKLYEPPPLDFSKVVDIGVESDLCIDNCAKLYLEILERIKI